MALSGIYVIGPNSRKIVIRDCTIEGADYGIRLINTGDVLVKNSQLKDNQTGIYAITEYLRMEYNVVSDNDEGINLIGTSGIVNIFNNVFYRNKLALNNNLNDLSLFNNIFYQQNSTDKAIASSAEIVSNYNIYYPQTNSFYSINGIGYHTLEDIRLAFELDMNSMVQDPEFINADSDDFNLEENSPAIDKGVYVGISTDMHGSPIPFGKAPDIGVLEKISMTSVDPVVIDNSRNLLVYPNPASDNIQLRFEGFVPGTYQVKVYDLLGNLVISQEMYSGESQTGDLNISTLREGMYLIRVNDGKGVASTNLLKL